MNPLPMSTVPGLVWPAMPSPNGQALLAFLTQLEQSQWLEPDAFNPLQARQLQQLLDVARTQVPFYRDQDKYRGAGSWEALPLLTRADLQDDFDAIQHPAPPAEHGAVAEVSTSGSTGRPVTVRSTFMQKMLSGAFSIRAHLWHGRDLGGSLASIHIDREGQANYPDGLVQPSWGWPTAEVFSTGPAAMLSLRTAMDQQFDWLERRNPDYFLTTPSNLMALSEYAIANGFSLPRLRDLSTVSELVSAELREMVGSAWKVPLIDTYSSQEVGSIAVQCPLSGHYHVMAEGILLEVLDDSGSPCRPGEIGKVVVTCLHNFAMPLIRYDIGDLAEVGGACACGRGLPVITRILGRVRNMLVLPNGGRHWPSFRRGAFVRLVPVRQHQFVQTAPDTIEARLVVERPLTGSEERQLANLFNERLPVEFRFRFVYVDEIPRHPSGKFEDFYSELT